MNDDKKIKTARRIAENIVLLGGPDLRNLPNSELIQRLEIMGENLSKTFAHASVSANQAIAALQRFSDAAKNIEINHATPTQE